jgi:hypothetical protein
MRTDIAQMLSDIDTEIHYTRTLIGRDAFAPRVMAAMAEVPRHLFVPEGDRDQAYANGPLPIGWGQTISQPYIVALMTDLLACGPDDRVLEIGTGSGYQAAVLSRLVGRSIPWRSSRNWRRPPPRGWRGWATPMSVSARAMAIRAGPNRPPSMASW